MCKLPIHCILCTDEHGRIGEAFVRRKKHPDLPDSIVLLVENSELKEWFLYNSGGIFDSSRDEIKHYQIWSTEDCIDVLCEEEPIIFALSNSDADNLIDGVSVACLRNNTVYYTDGIRSTFQLKPYIIPDVIELKKYLGALSSENGKKR